MYTYHEFYNLSPSQVLQKVTEVQIFEFALRKPVILNKRIYTSPFRVDNSPGCRILKFRGKLWFEDFAGGHSPRDCFNMIADLHNTSIREAVQIICNHFLLPSDTSLYLPPTEKFSSLSSDTNKKRASIAFQEREFCRRDKLYWSKSLITTEELKYDGVMALRNYTITKEGKGETFSPIDITYLYDFDGRYKIYRPESRNQDYRFITNCTKNDVGNLERIQLFGDELTITKSYKDHRVLKNVLKCNNVIWNQNESMIPDEDILSDLSVRFKKINILYDNDRQGMEGAEKLAQAFQQVKSDIQLNKRFLPKYKDPAEFIGKEGRANLTQVLNDLGIYGFRDNTQDCPFLLA